ncbi:MAG TPA: nicotinate phosphoribosyltransferase, partial [Propylenella sp.]
GEGRMKLSAQKRTLPGRKQVFRTTIDGTAEGDVIARYGEPLPGEPLLAPVMRDGVRLEPSAPLPAIQARARAEIARLPRALRALEPAAEPYLVAISPALQEYAAEVREKIAARSVQPKA